MFFLPPPRFLDRGSTMFPENPRDSRPGDPDVGDQNIERLLSQAYQPEAPDAEFIREVNACLLATAADLAQTREQAANARLERFRWRMAGVMSAAAILAGVALYLHTLDQKPT